jgi:arylsulfatase A-like enzyme
MNKTLTTLMSTLSLSVLINPVFAAPGDKIVFAADYQRLKEQKGDAWREEDKSVADKLKALEEKHGRPPNIVHIMWDDHSLGEVGIRQMNKVLGYDTPSINRMAKEGISFTRMYSEPSCTPTRTAALTGRLAVRAGMHKVGFPVDGMGLHKDEVTIAEVLSKAGYKTAFVGKAHQGDIEQSYMNNQGFDFANFSMYNQFPFMMWQEQMGPAGAVQGLFPGQWDKKYAIDEEFRPLGYINQLEGVKGKKATVYGDTSLMAYKKLLRTHQEMVLNYLDDAAKSDAPFYLAYWPHVYDAARRPEELTTSAGTWFAQSVVELDRDIGQILDRLEALNLDENTLVIAMADNGPMHELAPLGPTETIVRGGKGDYLEGGIRVPAFAWWPGVINADQIVGDIVSVHDLFTTFASLGGGLKYVPTDRVIDGIEQSALLLNGDGHSRRDYYHIYTGDILAASIKQQIKRTWIGDKPGLVGDGFVDLYKDPREEHPKMTPFLWAWAAFDHMRERHLYQIEKYPNRKPTHAVPYRGIENLPPEARELAERVPTSY